MLAPADDAAAIIHLSEVSPRAAVVEAWRVVELAVLNAVRAIGGESFLNATSIPQAIRLLERNESVDRHVISVLRDLRELRNEAAHAPEFALTKESAIEYAITAAAVARYLGTIGANGRQ